jgi:hypothetical protein
VHTALLRHKHSYIPVTVKKLSDALSSCTALAVNRQAPQAAFSAVANEQILLLYLLILQLLSAIFHTGLFYDFAT